MVLEEDDSKVRFCSGTILLVSNSRCVGVLNENSFSDDMFATSFGLGTIKGSEALRIFIGCSERERDVNGRCEFEVTDAEDL